MTEPVWRVGDRIFVRLPEAEQAVLGQLPELVAGKGEHADDPAAERMHPNRVSRGRGRGGGVQQDDELGPR